LQCAAASRILKGTVSTEFQQELPAESPPPSERLRAENQVIWTIWLTYGAFYFCRTNISAAVPGMKASVGEGGLGFSSDEVGLILASLKLAYGVGQFFNGQFSEHISPRKLLAVGMLGSAALNVLFGLSTGLYFLLFVWATNGYLQSLGWTPCVKVLANWIPVERRGRAIGIVGTGYQVTQGITFLVAGSAAHYLGWRGALYVPAAMLAASAVFMLLFLQDAPDEDEARFNGSRSKTDPGAPAFDNATEPQPNAVAWSLLRNLLLTLANYQLWLLGVALGLLNACRYGFLDWGLTHLKEVQATSVGQAAINYAFLPLGAVAGSYLAGWATDRLFGSRRAPVICILLVLLGVSTLAYDRVARTSVPGTIALLVFIGFCIYGPQVLLVGTAPADLARRGTSAAAAGFVNFMGYMGAASGDLVTGYFVDPKHGGWKFAIYIWAGWAFAAALAAALLWNATARKEDD
jgi:sugar phosphate permease